MLVRRFFNSIMHPQLREETLRSTLQRSTFQRSVFAIIALGMLSLSVSGCSQRRVTYSQEVAASNATAAWLQERYGFVLSSELDQLVSRVTSRLLESIPGSGASARMPFVDHPWQVYVLDTEEPNAFSTGARMIFLTKGLILGCRSEAELASVISHELAHHYLGHTGEVNERAAAEAELDPSHPNPGFSFSLEQEIDADTAALKVLKAAKYDLRDAVSVLSVMYYRSQNRVVAADTKWLDLRVANLQEEIRSAGNYLPATRNSREFVRVRQHLAG